MALKRTSDSRFKNQVQSGEQAWSFISLSLSQSQDPVMRHTSPQSRESASRHDVLKGFLLTREFITKSLEFQTTSNWLSWPLLQHSSLSPTLTKHFLNDYLCRWRLQFVQHWLFWRNLTTFYSKLFRTKLVSTVWFSVVESIMFTLRAPISNWQVRAMQLRVAQTSLATLLGTHILNTFSWGIRIEIRRYLT